MSVLVVDGMGGGIGSQIVSQLKKYIPEEKVIVVGTNSTATANMLRAGADRGATGENAIKVCLQKCRCVIGPMGIVFADSMLGEITPNISNLISASDVLKILIPVNHDNIDIAGLDKNQLMNDLIKDGVKKIVAYLQE